MFESIAIMLVLPAVIATGIVMLWLTAKRRYFALVFLASIIEYAYWLQYFRKVLTTPEYEVSLSDYALPTLAFACVMAVSLYSMKRHARRVRA